MWVCANASASQARTCDSSWFSRPAFEMFDVPARRPVSRVVVFLGHVLRDVILTADLSRADGDFSRAPGSNPLCVVAALAAQSGPALFCRRVCTKSEMTPWSFLPSFPTSQETFTLFLKDKKKNLKRYSKTMCVWETPYLAEGGNSRDIATITAKPVYVCSPQNTKNGSKYN